MIRTTRAQRIEKLKRRFPSTNKSKKQGQKTIVSRSLANHICKMILARSPERGARWLKRSILPALPLDSAWCKVLSKFANWLETLESSDDVFSDVFNLEGNDKLPFAAFSTLPGFTCPGAGDCLNWCYSYRAWRYPASFARQLANTVLMHHRRDIVEKAFLSLPDNHTVRLYVDGDVEDEQTLAFWCELMRRRPDLNCYGYTKSWGVFINYGMLNSFPNNYVMNESSGSIYGEREAIVFRNLKRDDGTNLVRGRFVGVQVKGFGRGVKRFSKSGYHKAVRDAAKEAFGVRAISCPGKCGDCGVKKHMCGDSNVLPLIAIGIG